MYLYLEGWVSFCFSDHAKISLKRPTVDSGNQHESTLASQFCHFYLIFPEPVMGLVGISRVFLQGALQI